LVTKLRKRKEKKRAKPLFGTRFQKSLLSETPSGIRPCGGVL
jgi:hypothetical protein